MAVTSLAAKETVTLFDLRSLNSMNDVRMIWEQIHATATLQGVVNRTKPRLYLFYVNCHGIDIDGYWWETYRQKGKWLGKVSTDTVRSVPELVTKFKDNIRGAVVYDPKVAATSNIASAIAGAEDLIAIRYDLSPNSLYSQIITGGPRFPVVVRLLSEDGTSIFTGKGKVPDTDISSSGSPKIDAYRWFIEKYLKKGKCNTAYAGYYIDQFWLTKPTAAPKNHHTLTNHDFFVSRRGFFFDLSPWGDEKATDDSRQATGADRKILEEMLLLAYKQNGNGKTFTYIGGFPAWAYKYTKHAGGSHDDVPTEWEFSRLIGAYNAFKDADAIGYGALANASFWQHYPLSNEYPQKWTSREELQKKGYLDANGKLSLGEKQLIVFYVGDYDASSWVAQRTPDIWDNNNRGKVPMMWCISPVLAERVPMALEYMRQTATENDYFAAADNGAGYLNPGELQEPRLSGLPDATTDWANHCKPYYKRWGLTVTGFVIDGYAEGLSPKGLDAYLSFSPNGIVPQKIPVTMLYRNEMPVLRADWDINDDNPKTAASQVVERVKARQIPFHWFRNILKSPEWYVRITEELKQLDPDIVLVDAPTFFELYRTFLKENPKYQ
ncbi:MAG: hypothetical protein LBD53_08495 [Tannerella sp.]|nr:hypothetical protein [Tannerella sp.]